MTSSMPDEETIRLEIPEPPFRPGDDPDFSDLEIPEPGAVARPGIDVKSEQTRDAAFSMIRVLGDAGEAVGPWAPKIAPEKLLDGLRDMMLTRAFDDRLLRTQRQGKISFYVPSTGEEGVSVAQAMALQKGDMFFPTYRQQGLLIARKRPLVDMLCHCFANSRDDIKGRQLPGFYSWKEGNFFTISGNLATQYSQAVGWAMASAYKNETNIASAWVGDGSTAEADFHYALTFASVYHAPVILNVINNQWAISSYQSIAGGANVPFAARGLGYGLPSLRVDGNDFLAVYAVTRWAAERARRGLGATFIEHYTYRGGAHSTSDDPSRYRPVNEWAAWPLGDPITRLRDHLIALGKWDEARHEELEQVVKDEVFNAFKEAEKFGTMTSGPRLSLSTVFEDVYKTELPHLRRQRQQTGV